MVDLAMMTTKTKRKRQTVKVADVEFDEKTFNRLFEKDIPTPRKRAPNRVIIPKSHYSGISPEQRAKNIQKKR